MEIKNINEEWIAELTESNCEMWSSDIKGNSRGEVINDGMEYAREEGLSSFRIGQVIPIGIPTLDADNILEYAYDQVYGEVGEVAEEFLENVSSEQKKELENELNEVFYNWITKHKLEPNCYAITNDEVIRVE